MITFRPVQGGGSAYREYVQLFSECFPAANKYSQDYLDWLYARNPDGQVVGFDAFEGDQLVAHYACVPARARVGGIDARVLLSLNTATHPQYQGQGLFTKLAEHTYAAGSEQGYDCVYGVANSNSTPGFTRKLKFQLVGPLHARFGIGRLGIDFEKMASIPHFRRLWSSEALAWRCASPVNEVTAHAGLKKTTFLAPALYKGAFSAAAEIDNVTAAAIPSVSPGHLRLNIGMVPPAARQRAFYLDIPSRLRPSPLNLIYRSLSGRIASIDPNAVFITFLDFDAY